ncbi:MAG: phosphate transport system regulatory protein PhoU [Candidatus Bathyarchaeum sp.]|nr:MAG: phosphate transport system regulatory protein PhoU [Candidatus Bathyarchaeum sp.]
MKRLIDAGLEQLASMLFRMGELAQKTVSLSIMNYLEGTHSPEQVKNLSDTLSDMAEPIEDMAFEIISRFQPVASDLRILKSYMKICYDFRRYGRYALDISQIYERVRGMEECDTSFRKPIEEMGLETLEMVGTSIMSLRNHDAELAKTLSEMEKRVDALYYSYLDKLVETKTTTGCTISSLLVVRYLERIADHATYIGESIVYLATGQKSRLR